MNYKVKEMLNVISYYANEKNWEGGTSPGPEKAREFLTKLMEEFKSEQNERELISGVTQLELFER